MIISFVIISQVITRLVAMSQARAVNWARIRGLYCFGIVIRELNRRGLEGVRGWGVGRWYRHEVLAFCHGTIAIVANASHRLPANRAYSGFLYWYSGTSHARTGFASVCAARWSGVYEAQRINLCHMPNGEQPQGLG